MSASPSPRCPQAEQSVGWALHALEPAEEVDAAAHLAVCQSCRELVDQAEEVLATLGSSAPTLVPPEELRVGLLARIAATPQQPITPPPTPDPAAPAEKATPPQPHPALEPVHTSARAQPDPQRTKPRDDSPVHPRRWRMALVAAAIIAALGIGALATRTAQVDQLRSTQTAQAQELARLLSEIQRPGARAAALSPAGGTPVAAVLVTDGESQVITLGLPPNASPASTYVLWGIGPDAPRALGTFDITVADSGLHRVGSVKDADKFTGYAISVEPGRTAPNSPSLMVASGQVQR